MKHAFKISDRKPESKKLLDKLYNNITIDLKGIGCES
jgi:hypothetical protein